MPGPPVKCHSCGTVFPWQGIGGVAPNVTFQGITLSSPCPNCGGMASSQGDWQSTPGGGWRRLYDVLSSATDDQREHVKEALTHARTADESGDEILRRLEAIAPEVAAALAPHLRGKRREFVVAVISALIGAITMLIGWKALAIAEQGGATDPPPAVVRPTEQELEQAFQQALDQALARQPEQPWSAVCKCGSGKRYKRCCGASLRP